ncbi:MAG: sensor histidine kinase [Vallitaleaceae bacterium]|nr:sensor histidine kinase [Vallitaleaceae bacterium]
MAVLLIVGFSKTLTGRLAILVKTMKDVKEDDLFVSFYNEDQDEIGELSRSFKNLIHRISTLINEVYIQKMSFQELELKQKETEFLALQSQINPHFLFNTIESIRMNALTNGDLGTSEILERFGKLLRRSFDWSSRFVTLSQEMLLVENYIMIQKFRYSDRFDYHLDIQSELLGIMIPKFIIQPIVENAIAHGLELKKSAGLLHITVFEQEGKLKIEVVDNGVGMTEERLMEVRQTIQSKDNTSSSSSIGLKNVCQRIRLIYGNEYGVELDSNPITGTKVVITLPMDARVGDQNV